MCVYIYTYTYKKHFFYPKIFDEFVHKKKLYKKFLLKQHDYLLYVKLIC